jgi:hypothetical protein
MTPMSNSIGILMTIKLPAGRATDGYNWNSRVGIMTFEL